MKEGSKYSHTYANKVFGGWDMCIEDEAAGNLQTMRLVNEIEVLLLSLFLKATLYKLKSLGIIVFLGVTRTI